MPDRMPERMSDRMSEYMPEGMSDRMSEYVSYAIYIYILSRLICQKSVSGVRIFVYEFGVCEMGS